MARLSNEEMMRMSLLQARKYTADHPAEAWRFAKMFGKEAIHQTKVALKHGYKAEKLFAEPEIDVSY